MKTVLIVLATLAGLALVVYCFVGVLYWIVNKMNK